MRLSSLTSPAGSFGYAYVDGISDRVQYLYPPGSSSPQIDNTYDGLARLLSTTLNSGGVPANSHAYLYDAGSQQTQQVFVAGNYVNYAYDKIGQLQTAQGWESDGTTPRLQERFGYAYDKAWNLSNRTNGSLVQTFNVNNLNELTTVTNKGTFTVAGAATEPKGGYSSWGSPSGVTNVVVSGTGLSSGNAELYLDGTWARTNATLANENNSYTATAKDTYGRQDTTSVSVNLPFTNTFAYDLNGNLRTNNTRIFDYDGENQLIRITEPSAWKSEFYYDGLMRRRIRKEYTWQSSAWIQTNEMRCIYDGMLAIQERDANNLPQVTYTRGNDLIGSLQGAGGIGGLLARTDNGQVLAGDSAAHAYYHCDGNGNVTCLINASNAVVAKYEYDPYGNILSQTGPLADANTYRFSSKEFHFSSGLYYYGYRWYDSTLQRWLNTDPIMEWGGYNLYVFAQNNAVGHLDYFGLYDPDDPKHPNPFTPRQQPQNTSPPSPNPSAPKPPSSQPEGPPTYPSNLANKFLCDVNISAPLNGGTITITRFPSTEPSRGTQGPVVSLLPILSNPLQIGTNRPTGTNGSR